MNTQEEDAKRRGFHDRRRGLKISHNPFVRSNLPHEPDKFEAWERGWMDADRQIQQGHINEYDE